MVVHSSLTLPSRHLRVLATPYVRAHFASPWPLLDLRRQEEAQRAHIMGQILDPASGKGPPLKLEMQRSIQAQSRQDRSKLAGVARCCKHMLAPLIWLCRCCQGTFRICNLCCWHFVCCCFKDCVRRKHVPFYFSQASIFWKAGPSRVVGGRVTKLSSTSRTMEASRARALTRGIMMVRSMVS